MCLAPGHDPPNKQIYYRGPLPPNFQGARGKTIVESTLICSTPLYTFIIMCGGVRGPLFLESVFICTDGVALEKKSAHSARLLRSAADIELEVEQQTLRQAQEVQPEVFSTDTLSFGHQLEFKSTPCANCGSGELDIPECFEDQGIRTQLTCHCLLPCCCRLTHQLLHSTVSKNGPMNMDLYKIKRRGIESSHFRKLRTWSNGIFLFPFSINQC